MCVGFCLSKSTGYFSVKLLDDAECSNVIKFPVITAVYIFMRDFEFVIYPSREKKETNIYSTKAT